MMNALVRDIREIFFPSDIPSVTLIFFIVFVLAYCLQPFGEQQFSFLANSFLHGKLYFIQMPGGWADTSFFNGRYYWPLGPFPAIVLMPFVFFFSLFRGFFYQGYLSFFITITIIILWYRIAHIVGYSKKDARYSAVAFCCASAYIMIAFWQWGWYFAHAITILLLSAGLYEYIGKKRYGVMGALMALAAMTRITAGVGSIFFLIDILFLSSEPWEKKKMHLLYFCMPIFGAGIILAIYNYARFENVFNQGYALQFLVAEGLNKAREYGMFSVIHIPANLFYSLLAVPLPVFRDSISSVLHFPFIRPNLYGMSIFVTSPYLLSVFFRRVRSGVVWALLITCFCIYGPLLMYYASGYRQFGYRYALDFFPFLFFVFLLNNENGERKFSFGMHLLFLISASLNFYLTLFFY